MKTAVRLQLGPCPASFRQEISPFGRLRIKALSLRTRRSGRPAPDSRPEILRPKTERTNNIRTTFFKLLDSAADATAEQGGWLSTLLTFLPFVLLIVVFYFMLIRPQKKQQRELDAMRSSIAKGDIVTTKGGIVGIVVNIKDDMLLLQTGGEKTTIQVQKWAVATVESRHEEKSDETEK